MIEKDCPSCGVDMESSICGSCGWDLTTAVVQMSRPPLKSRILAGVWRVLVLGLIVAVPVIGASRLLKVGPGPDLATSLRWIVVGDEGRAAELITLHRAYEIASAAARFAVREFEAPPFDGDWGEVLDPFATMKTRGWIPLLFIGAMTDSAPTSVKEFYEVSMVDGWGHSWQLSTRLIERGADLSSDAEVQNDLSAVLNQSFAVVGIPDFAAAQWMRLELVSSAHDGILNSGDDIRFVSYFPVGFTFHLSGDQQELQNKLDEAYFHGRHFFRYEGARYDLIDARLLAEFRMQSLS
jgi:hypothetical protein